MVSPIYSRFFVDAGSVTRRQLTLYDQNLKQISILEYELILFFWSIKIILVFCHWIIIIRKEHEV